MACVLYTDVAVEDSSEVVLGDTLPLEQEASNAYTFMFCLFLTANLAN
jgi:hypothetical protein